MVDTSTQHKSLSVNFEIKDISARGRKFFSNGVTSAVFVVVGTISVDTDNLTMFVMAGKGQIKCQNNKVWKRFVQILTSLQKHVCLSTCQDGVCKAMPICGVAAMSALIVLLSLHSGERNVDKLGLGFDFRTSASLGRNTSM